MSYTVSRDKLDAYGVEAVCNDVSDTKTLTAIAREQGVSIGSLLAWIEAEPERSARVREARAYTARLWDERAEEEIRLAEDEMGMKKARELAHHYRWRAAKIAPRDYGDKVQQEITGANGGPIQLTKILLGDLEDDD